MKIAWILSLLVSSSLYAQINPDLPEASTLTKAYLEELSKREVGQSKFVVKTENFYRPQSSPAGRGAQQQQEQSDSRDIQESDVFKLGKKGQKELFLLNRYRGFQVVSFKDGLENPKIIGRFPVYNNWSSEMYFLEKEEKVLVVNTEWSFSQNYWQTNYNTILYLIDVANSSEPKIIKEITVPGYLQESRMVGDVLYTITNNGAWNEMKAQITSVKLNGNTFSTIDRKELHSESRWVRTMNVVKEGSKYFVISTLSNWNAQGDLVNVHDITSDKGQIEKVFTAKARGQISERSQTFFHKNHLFAVSNYMPTDNGRMRVSVEAFPVAKSTAIVESKENMRVSVGDTTGQHASLQDVRVSGDLLYAFWVPANNIDPFDLFDISEPSKGIKHLGQLQFDGWISKAFPIEHDNKKFVLGLGWIVPTTSENNRRFPQAKLFEIKKVNNTFKHEVVASLTLDSDDVWASLNDQDKYFEILQETPGVYNILFPVTFSKTWKSGAKIVTADLGKNALSEGASIVGDQGWLNRVFVNREVRAINTFSDMSLETFNQDDVASNGIAKTVSVLELARNIIDFHVINDKEAIQIISHDKKVELRQVDLLKADSEKSEAISAQSVAGNYQWHKVKNNKVFIITSTNKVVRRNNQNYEWNDESFDYATLHVVDLNSGAVNSERIDVVRNASEQYYWFNLKNTSSEKHELFTIGKQFFKLDKNSLVPLEIAADCRYFFETKEREFSLQTVGKDIFVFNTFTVTPKDGLTTRMATYSMPFMKQLHIDGNQISCGTAMNVPGRPVLIENNFLVTSDTESYHFYPRGINYDYISVDRYFPGYGQTSQTFSLKMTSARTAELVDILKKDITSGLFLNGFVTYAPAESRIDIWTLNAAGELVSKPQYLDYADTRNTSLITVKQFQGRNFLFMKNEKNVDLYELTNNKKLAKLNVTSEFDLNENDGSAEFIFAMEEIAASKDLSRFYISQGHYGLSEIIIK